MTGAEILIQEYNRLDHWLRRACNIGPEKSFALVLSIASKNNWVVRNEHQFLLSIGNLRNAIIHDKDYPTEIIAEPRKDVLARFQSICKKIYAPPKLNNGSPPKPVIFSPLDKLSKALPFMNEHDFSQIVVKWVDRFVLITREGIAMWVEANIQEDVISIKDAKLDDILGYENQDACSYLSNGDSFYDAAEKFSQATGRLQAILVTHSGKSTEAPLRVITPWDMLEFLNNE